MSSKNTKNFELRIDGLENLNPEMITGDVLPHYGGNHFHENTKIKGKIKRTVKAYSSHEDMENQQVTYWMSLKTEERLRQLKELIIASFGIKSDPKFTELSKSINFEKDR